MEAHELEIHRGENCLDALSPVQPRAGVPVFAVRLLVTGRTSDRLIQQKDCYGNDIAKLATKYGSIGVLKLLKERFPELVSPPQQLNGNLPASTSVGSKERDGGKAEASSKENAGTNSNTIGGDNNSGGDGGPSPTGSSGATTSHTLAQLAAEQRASMASDSTPAPNAPPMPDVYSPPKRMH